MLKMKQQLLLLVFAVLVGAVSAQLTYECYPNSTIVVTNPDPSHFIGAYANNAVGQCTTTYSGDYTKLIITGCSMNEDILLQLTNRSASDTILGGSGIYLTIVRCDEIDATGVPRTIVAKFSPTLLVTTEGVITPKFSIDTQLRTGGTVGNGYSDGSLVSRADVGTAIHWILEIPADYYAKLVTCTAYSGTSSTGSPSDQIITDGCSDDDKIVEDWLTSKSVVVGLSRYYYTTLYAFRFYNSADLYLDCNVKICPSDGSANCFMECLTRRKRRASSNKLDDATSIFARTGTGLTVLYPSSGAGRTAGVGQLTLLLILLMSLVTG